MIEKIAVICMYPFPVGLAATNRIIAYSKGIIFNGGEVHVFSVNPSDYDKGKYEAHGVFEGIHYHYPGGRIRSAGKISHAFEIIKAIIKTWFFVYRKLSRQELDIIIISSEAFFLLFPFSILAWVKRKKSIFIFDEYPSKMRNRKYKKVPFWIRLKYWIALYKITGLVSIVDDLLEVYDPHKRKKTLILSTITDVSKYERGKEYSNERGNYLCYMGSLDLSKDNVELIVNAFAKIKNEYPEIDFHIYGNGSDRDRNIISDTIKKNNLEKRVLFKGQVDSSQVAEILMRAKILVSSQLNTIRIQGGIPTKLGEYLASGTPTVLSDVGHISEEMENNKHLFLVCPGNPVEYARTLKLVLSNYNNALQVAENGRAHVWNNFSHTVKGRILLTFFQEI